MRHDVTETKLVAKQRKTFLYATFALANVVRRGRPDMRVVKHFVGIVLRLNNTTDLGGDEVTSDGGEERKGDVTIPDVDNLEPDVTIGGWTLDCRVDEKTQVAISLAVIEGKETDAFGTKELEGDLDFDPFLRLSRNGGGRRTEGGGRDFTQSEV